MSLSASRGGWVQCCCCSRHMYFVYSLFLLAYLWLWHRKWHPYSHLRPQNFGLVIGQKRGEVTISECNTRCVWYEIDMGSKSDMWHQIMMCRKKIMHIKQYSHKHESRNLTFLLSTVQVVVGVGIVWGIFSLLNHGWSDIVWVLLWPCAPLYGRN